METSEPGTVTGKRGGKRGVVIAGMKELGALVGQGAWAFVWTLAQMVMVGMVLGVACAWIIPEGFWWRLLAGVVVLGIFGVEGWVLGLKRALAAMIVAGVRRYRVASRVLGLIFEAMEGVLGEGTLRKGERLPLRKAEEVLRKALAPVADAAETGGWFRRWVVGWMHRRLVKMVGQVTLAEFRKAEAEEGGVALDVVREVLAGKIDRMVEKRMMGGVWKLTRLIMGVTVVVVLGTAVGVRAWRVRAGTGTMPASGPVEAG